MLSPNSRSKRRHCYSELSEIVYPRILCLIGNNNRFGHLLDGLLAMKGCARKKVRISRNLLRQPDVLVRTLEPLHGLQPSAPDQADSARS